MSHPDVTLNEVTHLLAHIVLGDSGIGGWPLDGELVLSTGPDEAWRGRLSLTALDHAEEVWASRSLAKRLTKSDATAVLRAAVDCDAAFYGLVPDWVDARVEVEASIARVSASVRHLPEPVTGLTDQRASVVLELVDVHPKYAVWQVDDPSGALLEEEALGVEFFDGPDLEALWRQARAVWSEMVARTGWTPAHDPDLNVTVHQLEAGSCGELRVSAWVG